MSIRYLLASLFAFLACAPLASPAAAAETDGKAAAARLVPAHFGAGKRAFYELLEYPDSVSTEPGIRAVISCEIIVSEKGKVEADYCFSPLSPPPAQEFATAVYTALGKSRFSPAKVDGSPVTVAMNLQVIFRCDEGVCAPVAFPNFGRHAQRLGSAYISPQEIIQENNWYERVLLSDICLSGTQKIAEACVSERMATFAVQFEIDAEGVPSEVRPVSSTDPGIEGFADAAVREAGRARFIPAFYNGSFMPMSAIHSALYQEKSVGKSKLPRTICEEESQIGSRLTREVCYTPLEFALRRQRSQVGAYDIYNGYSTFQ